MKKPYEGHEIAYRRMKKDGVLVWGQKGSGTYGKSCRSEINGFLKDIINEVRKAGFDLKLVRYNTNNSKDFCGTITIGALKTL